MVDTTVVKGVQTALRAVDILEAFRPDRQSMSLSEIAEAVGLSVPTTHRLVKALTSRDLLVVEPSSKRYSLGAGVMQLARVIMERDDISGIARPGLERLRSATNETVSLQRLVGDERIVIAELVSGQRIRTASVVGAHYSLTAGGAGKAILAFLPEATRTRIIAQHGGTPNLERDLAEVRGRGYALSSGEVVEGAVSLAVPVFDSSFAVAGAINITGPQNRFDIDYAETFAPIALEEAGALSALLGGVPWQPETSAVTGEPAG
ncbi:UNVERIFIED_ORG: DNA-binding IclR family transcriptional regulator [Paenarthrobacter nicotinovorans]